MQAIKGTIAFDYDGVIHNHAHWCPPGRPDCHFDFHLISEAQARGYAVAIVTAGEPPQIVKQLRLEGFQAVGDPQLRTKYWQDPKRVLVTERKIVADIYVDDKAHQYQMGTGCVDCIWASLEGSGCPVFEAEQEEMPVLDLATAEATAKRVLATPEFRNTTLAGELAS